MAKARSLADAPEGGIAFEHANPNYEGGELRPLPPLDEDTTARLHRLRLAGEEALARSFVARPDGGYDVKEVL